MRKIFALTVAILMVLASCSKQDLETICINQESQISGFIATQYADFPVVDNAGSHRIIMENGFGNTAQPGNSVNITYRGSIFDNGPSTQFADNTTINVNLDGRTLVKGLENGILGMKEGESAFIVFSARQGFWNEQVGMIPSMSALIYYVTLQKINSNQ